MAGASGDIGSACAIAAVGRRWYRGSGREDHLRIGTGRAFGRLCDECFDTLLGARSIQEVAATAPERVVHRQLAGAGRPPR